MNKIRLGKDEIKCITFFESLTGAKVQDCVDEEGFMGFIVRAGDMGLAIGKKGSNIERVRKAFGKSVWIIEYSEKPEDFIKNMFHQANVKKVSLNGGNDERKAVIEVSRADRTKIIGPEGRKIRMAKKLAKRHFDIVDVSVKTV
ncbi:MAG: NusA-like transcription termination signal-binding factor [Candidatus Altiarchaeota archaeon]